MAGSSPSPGPSTLVSVLLAWWARRPPAAGAAVMTAGILSVGLRLAGYDVLSDIALAVTVLTWLGLAADFAVRLSRQPRRWLSDSGSPAALSAVAATTVLGSQFSALGRQTLAEALLALAVVLWPVLLFLALRGWRRGMPGSVFLACVATQGPAVLGAAVAHAVRTAWPAHVALVFFWLGLALYAVALYFFDWRQVVRGHGDHWVAGGALAISALAGAELLKAGKGPSYLWSDDGQHVLHSMTVTLLVLALAWYVVLWAAELLRPRPRYDIRRWSTTFPLGMTAAALLSAAPALGAGWLRTPGQVLLWIAVVVCLAVTAGAAVGPLRTIRSTGPR
ncbi:tellurite resistance/C4-dicarboxylate transporter family protein [Streptomyces griseoaurantiacus]|uniref:tellurite resistance/C4-dicarboxylate transporter family protein n=1 Tax=Streptomyces griseoaurantiacus TaxID=68213 RepID=UPI001786C15B|nr:membrane protein [Streptomyces griseoaurantiacus]